MTAWFDGVDISVEVAFLDAPLAESPTWTDITAYVRSVDTDAGRSSEYTEYSPRRLVLTLGNNDRRFDPEYLDDPAYVGTPVTDEGGDPLTDEFDKWIRGEGDPDVVRILPMRRVRVQATYSATTYPVFDGFILGWPQVVRGMVDETVRVEAVDGSRFLEQAVLADSAYRAAVLADSPIHYWPLQEQVTTPSARYTDVVNNYVLEHQASQIGVDAVTGPRSTNRSAPVADSFTCSTGYYSNTSSAPLVYLDPCQLRVPEATPVVDDVSGVEGWVYYSTTDPLAIAAGGNAAGVVEPTVGENILLFTVNAQPGQNSASLFVYYDDGTVAVSDTLAGVVPPGLHHIAVWHDAVAAEVLVYLDGALLDSLATSASTTTDPLAVYGAAVSISAAASGVLADPVDFLSDDPHGFSHFAVYAGSTEPDWQLHYIVGLTAFGHPYGDLGGARIGRVLDEIAWPAALRDLSTGDTVHGQYLPARQSALDYLRDVSAGEDGLLFFAADGKLTFRSRSWQWAQASSGTFSDDGAGLGYSDIRVDANSVDPIRNQVAVSFRSTDGYVRVEDSASIAAYGVSSENVSASTVDSASIARGLANYRLRSRKDPRTLITELEVVPRSDPTALFPVVLGIDLGDVVSVERTPAGIGSQVVKSLTVQGVEHSISSDQWTTRYYLAPAPTSGADAPYLLVNTSGDTSLVGESSGNLIPF